MQKTIGYWKEVWRFRELLYTLSWRDIKVRYKQTIIGVAWSILRPLLTTIILTILFTRITKVEHVSSTPYPILVFIGMLPWQFFSNTLSEVSFSIVNNSSLIGKIYFPRMVIPLATVATNLVDLFISLILFALMLIWYQFMPGWQIIFLPVFLIMSCLCVCGAGLYLAVLNVAYRDIKFIIPFILQFGLFVTPVGFSSSNIPEQWRLIYALNPMVGIISGMRWCIAGEPIYWPEVWISATGIFLLLIIGISYFRRMERTFADNI